MYYKTKPLDHNGKNKKNEQRTTKTSEKQGIKW